MSGYTREQFISTENDIIQKNLTFFLANLKTICDIRLIPLDHCHIVLVRSTDSQKQNQLF